MGNIAHTGKLDNGWSKILEEAGEGDIQSIYERNALEKRSNISPSDVEMKVIGCWGSGWSPSLPSVMWGWNWVRQSPAHVLIRKDREKGSALSYLKGLMLIASSVHIIVLFTWLGLQKSGWRRRKSRCLDLFKWSFSRMLNLKHLNVKKLSILERG